MKTEPNESITGNPEFNLNGLSKREYFAAMAMQGILGDQTFVQLNQPETIAPLCVAMADALISELNNPPLTP